MTTTATSRPIPAVLTLREQTIITNPPDIIAYELSYFLKAPKSASDTTRDAMESYMDIVSRNTDISVICGLVNQALTGIYNRIFSNPGDNTTVNVSNSTSDGINYTLTIEVSVVTNGQTYTTSSQIHVDESGRLVLDF